MNNTAALGGAARVPEEPAQNRWLVIGASSRALIYPIVVAGITVAIGLLFLPETMNRPIVE